MRHRSGSHRFGIEVLADPDTVTSFLGEVHPGGLYDLLTRLARDYRSPRLIVTENGCGFGPADERVVEGRVHDALRTRFLKDHLRQVHRALAAGAPVDGYIVWSAFDHFEYTAGFGRRYGLIHVDFDSQERLWKDSAAAYREIVTRRRLRPLTSAAPESRAARISPREPWRRRGPAPASLSAAAPDISLPEVPRGAGIAGRADLPAAAMAMGICACVPDRRGRGESHGRADLRGLPRGGPAQGPCAGDQPARPRSFDA